MTGEPGDQPLEHLAQFFELSLDLFCVATEDGWFRLLNPAWERVLGWSLEELYAKPWYELVVPDDFERTTTASAVDLSERDLIQFETRFRTKDGGSRWIAFTAPNWGAGEGMTYAVGRDITERRMAEDALQAANADLDERVRVRTAELESTNARLQREMAERLRVSEELRRSERRYRELAENARDVLYRMRVAPTKVLEYVSPAVSDMSGYSSDELLESAERFADLVHPDDRRLLDAALESVEAVSDPLTLRWIRSNGETIWTEHRMAPVTDEGELIAVEGIARDITQLKSVEAELARQALHDPLTGLPNRQLFMNYLERALARQGREDVAVLFLDLDRFKVVNDSLGHGAGDVLLVAVAERLKRLLEPHHLIARFGGDEFVVLVEGSSGNVDAEPLAERICAEMARPFVVDGQEAYATVSIGIARAIRGLDLPADLLRYSDVAMYRAKSGGRNRHEVFDDRFRDEITQRIRFENALRHALERDELRLWYQPVVDLASGLVVGVEALLRWDRGNGVISAGEFIDVAEETGLVLEFGAWALGQACRQAVFWTRTAKVGERFQLSVNLSPPELSQVELTGLVSRALDESGLEPSVLCLEITESALVHGLETASMRLAELRKLGARVAIDDFGTGYASFAYLRNLPVDLLKVDRSFVAGLGTEPHDLAIVEAIIRLADTLGFDAIAEGVETELQRETLMRLGCRSAQGFLLGRPAPAVEVSRRLEQERGGS